MKKLLIVLIILLGIFGLVAWFWEVIEDVPNQ